MRVVCLVLLTLVGAEVLYFGGTAADLDIYQIAHRLPRTAPVDMGTGLLLATAGGFTLGLSVATLLGDLWEKCRKHLSEH